MASPCFIGNELSAAGWRLAGFDTIVPPVAEVEQVVRQAMSRAPLLILTGDVARRLHKAMLEQVLASVAPLVLVVPDMQPGSQGLDVAAQIRGQLGLPT